jgi:hypothetical protein
METPRGSMSEEEIAAFLLEDVDATFLTQGRLEATLLNEEERVAPKELR